MGQVGGRKKVELGIRYLVSSIWYQVADSYYRVVCRIHLFYLDQYENYRLGKHDA
jgi:hypothetical protein